MTVQVLQQAVTLDAAFARLYTYVVDRSWGQLSHNPQTPDHYDANKVRQFTAGPDPDRH